MFFYKTRGDKLEKTEYRCVKQLPVEFSHTSKTGSRVVIAVQESLEKKEYEIGLHDLVNFFKAKKLILQTTADRILEFNDLRNTFHLSKARDKKCDLGSVEEALKLLLYILERAPRGLQKA